MILPISPHTWFLTDVPTAHLAFRPSIVHHLAHIPTRHPAYSILGCESRPARWQVLCKRSGSKSCIGSPANLVSLQAWRCTERLVRMPRQR